ncbi:hypothetical protein TH25_06375 [Thalassospira profundimaris]|uniref:Uncharacterized protein n=1 Tax=Thalassospira profundimaris TaxID=502049 RepID=A0A367XG48_9PROT|nr:hypothetical protein [Thalassospira profundimaris]RCK52654.1 hypothetical protein TH25_06375 [Thalassospira profundimaris]
MLEWIKNHHTVLQITISFLTLGVWIFYAQILLAQYRRTRRPKILINQTRGRTLHSRFLVSNMSLESVHIEVILVGLFGNEEQTWHKVSDWEPMSDDSQADTNAYGTFQGPLAAGCSLDIGDIKRLITQRDTLVQTQTNADNPGETGLVTENGANCRSFEIMVMGVYSSEKGVIGASRTFDLDEHGHVYPRDAETGQCRSRSERQRMRELHRRHL